MVKHTLEILQHLAFAAGFLSVSDNFGTLCIRKERATMTEYLLIYQKRTSPRVVLQEIFKIFQISYPFTLEQVHLVLSSKYNFFCPF